MVNWSIDELKSEAVLFAEKYGYPAPEQVILSDRMTRSLGRVYVNEKIIRLNKRFIEINNQDVVRALLVHEVVHLKHGDHGDGFEKDMKKLGYGKHLDCSGLGAVIEKYVYVCKCGEEYDSSVELRGRLSCKKCGGNVRYSYTKTFPLIRYY